MEERRFGLSRGERERQKSQTKFPVFFTEIDCFVYRALGLEEDVLSMVWKKYRARYLVFVVEWFWILS